VIRGIGEKFAANPSIGRGMIAKFKPETEFPTAERCHIVEMLNLPEYGDCSIARARIQPGVTTQLHSLRGITERYVILQGQGQVEIGGQPLGIVAPLDVIHIRPGVSQRITNTGHIDLVILCVCTPRFRPECYEPLEPTI
jgi:mannose-6-phosphate isomerase-like protein (cupin superfamily)